MTRKAGTRNVTAHAGVAEARAGAWSPTVVYPTAAIGSTAMGTATAPVFDAGQLRQAATEYNVARTAGNYGIVQTPVPWDAAEGLSEPVIAVPRVPLTANAQRVASIVMGSWVASGSGPGCDPDTGVHELGCGHRANRVHLSRYQLAKATFGRGGGSQLDQVDKSLDELYDEGTEYLVYDAATGARARQRGRILELTDLRETEKDDVLYEVRFGAYLLDSLMDGHYQSFPVELVQGLSGADFLVWLAVLTQTPTRKLVRAGQTVEYSVSGGHRGRKVAIDPARLKLGRQRPDKLRASLERAAMRGNAIAGPRLGLRLTVQDREHESGLKLVLARTVDRARLRAGRGPAIQDALTGNPGRSDRQSRTRNVRETDPRDTLERHVSKRQRSNDRTRVTEGTLTKLSATLTKLSPSSPTDSPPPSRKEAEPESPDPQLAARRRAMAEKLLAEGMDPESMPWLKTYLDSESKEGT